jgi:hypothetical protein
MALPSEGWFSLPASTRFAGASEQPRPPALTVVGCPAPPARGSAPPPPPSGVRLRKPSIHELSDSDLIVESESVSPATDSLAKLREDVGDLELLGGSWQAAAFSAAVLSKAVHARAVIIHVVDEATSKLRIIGVKGSNTNDLLGVIAEIDDDFVGSTVATNRQPLTMTFDGDLPRVLPSRFTTVGAKTSLVAAPVIADGRCIAWIEVIDATSGSVTEACAIVTQRLSSLLVKRP